MVKMEHTVGRDQWSWPHASVNSANLQSISADFAPVLWHKNVTYSPTQDVIDLISLAGFRVLPMIGYF